MMSRVTLVRSQINRAIDVNRKIGIYLNNAVVMPLVPVIAAPRFIGDVFNSEIFIGRQFDVRDRAFPARLDRESKHCVEFLFGNKEIPPPLLISLKKRSVAGNFRLKFSKDLLE